MLQYKERGVYENFFVSLLFPSHFEAVLSLKPQDNKFDPCIVIHHNAKSLGQEFFNQETI